VGLIRCTTSVWTALKRLMAKRWPRPGSLGALDLSAIDMGYPKYALHEAESRFKVEHLFWQSCI
jgi:hypothetical protein